MKPASQLAKNLRGILEPPPNLSVSDWADSYRMLPAESAEPGRYKTSRVPYMREVMNALTQGDVHKIAVKSSSQVGKALSLTEPIMTPDGFKLMGDIQVGDKVFDERGQVCNVIATSPIMNEHDCYELTFSDGAKIVADAGHRWYVHDDISGKLKEKILTTEELSHNFKSGNRNRYAIPVAKPLQLPKRDLPIDSYTLGAWLGGAGDVPARALNLDEDDAAPIRARIESAGYDTDETYYAPETNFVDIAIYGKKFDKWIKQWDLSLHKHIPPEYLRGSYEQRLELLRGYFDTDGACNKNGRCEITQKSKGLADGLMELLWTLGFKPTLTEKIATFTYKGEKRTSRVWRISFLAYDDVKIFHLERKASRQKSRAGCRTSETLRRRIINVVKVESRPVKCISVDSPSHLFLAGRELIPTHNSDVLLNIVGRMAMLDPCNILLVQPTLEDAMDFSKVRLQKMISDTKVLTPLFYDKLRSRNADQTILSKMFKGGRVILKGANSPSGLASRPIRILLCDEVDRYPKDTGEGDPVALATVRCSTYWNYKVALFSTPTVKGSSRIDSAFEEGTQEEWSHRCPNCSSWEVLDFRQMVTDFKTQKDSAGNKTVIVNDVKWRCAQCGYSFSEQQMRAAAQVYIVKNPDALKNGVRSFFINGFASPWLSWREIMREWLEAQGNPTREAVVYNTRFGLSYEMPAEVDERDLADKLEDYGGEIPDGVILLTTGVDVQKNRLELGIYGWNAEECWAIASDIIRGQPNNPTTWQALDAVLDRTFYFADGTPIKIARTFVDSGYATSFVYEYCRRRMFKGVFAIKGVSLFGAPLINKTTKLKDEKIFLTSLNVDEGKNYVYALLTADKIHFGRDVDSLRRNLDETYFRQLTSEHRVRNPNGREVWKLRSANLRNEQLDIVVYSLAAMRSCIAGDEKSWWANQAENLRGGQVVQTKKTSVIRSKEISLW